MNEGWVGVLRGGVGVRWCGWDGEAGFLVVVRGCCISIRPPTPLKPPSHLSCSRALPRGVQVHHRHGGRLGCLGAKVQRRAPLLSRGSVPVCSKR